MMCMKGPNKDGEYPKIAPAQVQTLGSSRMCQPDYVYLNRTGQCIPMCAAPQGIQQVLLFKNMIMWIFLTYFYRNFLIVLKRLEKLFNMVDI